MLQKEKENSAQSLAKFQLSKPEAAKTVTFTIEGENEKKSSVVRLLYFFLCQN